MHQALVTATEAAVWTGRPKGTIWRWASEKRISRVTTPQGTKYDLAELPPKSASGEPASPPPLPHRKGC